MKKTILLQFILLSFTYSCHQNSLMGRLEQIDSISTKKEDKKALEELEKIAPETIEDNACLAYYWLLKIRTDLRLNKKIESTQAIDVSINYYKKINDKSKLVRAYLSKAYIYNQSNDLAHTALCLKEAESFITDDENELPIAFRVYHNLAVVNNQIREKDIALKYSKLALKTAYKLNQQEEIAYSLMTMWTTYNKIGKKDSAKYYINKCIPLIANLPEDKQVTYFNNIGMFQIQEDINQAEHFLTKALNIKPNAYTYRGLARTYLLKGERDKAKAMWEKALQTDRLYLKAEVMQAMYDSQQEEGDYKNACETAMKLVALKDSISKKEKEEDIRGLQERFERKQELAAEKNRRDIYISITCFLLLIALALTTFLYFRNSKGRKELRKTKDNLERYQQQLKLLERENKGGSKTVQLLTEKINELQKKHNSLLQNGRERYEEIMDGGTTIKWSRNDFSDCIEYYRSIDGDFVAHMELDYRHLSPKYIFFAVLEHMGKSDEELQHVMAISQTTVRSIRSRINKQKGNI